MGNRVTTLFGIQYPIVQGGMVWASGWKLATAVSRAGGLGLIGAGSMHPETLAHHLQSAKAALQDTTIPFGVNVPLLYPALETIMHQIVAAAVPIVFTSAGNPKTWTAWLKSHGIQVVHVTASTKFALKALEAGCDAVVAEGFEAGGHNGREETTTMVLTPLVVEAVGQEIPVLAAGGIGRGRQMAAAMALGADGVQVGSRFAATQEASCHPHFKQAILEAGEGDTVLTMKKTVPVRLLKNPFQAQIAAAEAEGARAETLKAILGKGRAKKGMFEGDLEAGELEIGQIAADIHDLPFAAQVIERMMTEYRSSIAQLPRF